MSVLYKNPILSSEDITSSDVTAVVQYLWRWDNVLIRLCI